MKRSIDIQETFHENPDFTVVVFIVPADFCYGTEAASSPLHVPSEPQMPNSLGPWIFNVPIGQWIFSLINLTLPSVNAQLTPPPAQDGEFGGRIVEKMVA
jgi:hypothetical protein